MARIPSFTGRIAAAYVQLCQDPARNWRAWLAVTDTTNPAAAPAPANDTGRIAAAYVRLCQNPARSWRAWFAVTSAAPVALHVSAVADYVQLCQNPATDWRAWLADQPQQKTGGLNDYLESTDRLCRVALHELQGWMDSNQRRRGVDYLPTGSTADTIQFDDVQPVREARRIGRADEDAAGDVAGRRFAMLQAFMRAGRGILFSLPHLFRGGKGKRGKSKSRSTGGSVRGIRTAKRRADRRAARLRRLMVQRRQERKLRAPERRRHYHHRPATRPHHH